MTTNTKLLILIAASIFLTRIADAAPTTETMENLVVTGTRLENSVASMPSHVTVIDRFTLESSQHRSVLDLLGQVAGIHVTQYGGRGGVSSVFVRGAEPNFTVVLVDGVKVNDPNDTRGGSFDFSTLNLSEIERIEIVRGAQSALYGSDGLAGIINIITRAGAEALGGAIEAELGTEGFRRGSVHTSGPVGKVARFALTVTGADDGDGIAGNAFSDTNVAGRLLLEPGEHLTINLSARYGDANSESFPEDSGGPRLAVIRDVDERDQEQTSVAGALAYAMSDATTLNFRASFVNRDVTSSSPGVATGVRDGVPPNRSDATLERLNLGANLAFALSEAITTTVGVDFEDEQGEVTGSLDLFPGFSLPTDFSLERDLVGVFGEFQYRNDRGPSLSLALRHDKPEDRSAKTSARLGLQYQFANTRVFSTYSEGYKLPSFFALGHALVGNPNLRPESSTSIEIGAATTLWQDRLQLTVAAFDNTYEDLIDFDPDLFTSVNRSEVTTRGAELAIEMQARDDLRLSARLANIDIDVSENVMLRHRPEWRGGVSAHWDMTSTMNLGVDWTYAGTAFDSSIPTGGQMLDANNHVDLELGWRPNTNLRVWLAIDNLFDESYEEAIGFPALPLRARLGVRYNF